MRTAQGVSHMSVAEELAWLVGYACFELMVWGSTWWFLGKIVREGPNMTSPIMRGGDETLGTPAHGGDGEARASARRRRPSTPSAPGQPQHA